MNDSTPGDSVLLAASFNLMREPSAEGEIFQLASFPAKKLDGVPPQVNRL
jgi:hypothetical protein